MRTIINATTIFGVSILLCACAANPDAATVSPTGNSTKANPAVVLKDILEKVEKKFPELKSEAITSASGTRSVEEMPTVWRGEEYASVELIVREKPRYHPPGTNPRGGLVPIIDLQVEIARYASAADTQKALEKSLFSRPAMTPPKEIYKGATLYKYSSGWKNVICQSEQYIVEIQPGTEDVGSLTMKILDFILAELVSTSPKRG